MKWVCILHKIFLECLEIEAIFDMYSIVYIVTVLSYMGSSIPTILYFLAYSIRSLNHRNYLKERPSLNAEAEKFNEHPAQTRKGVLIWKLAVSAEVLIQIVYKNDETRIFFCHMFFAFYNKEIYKHIL